MSHLHKGLVSVNRREFLKYTGLSSSGLILGGSLAGGLSGALPAWAKTSALNNSLMLNLFVHIAPDDSVSIIAHRSEMGTGIKTSLPQVVADEMEADWEKVKVVQGQANSEYGSQNTDGSRSVRDFYAVMREMGASAKLMLRQAAAKEWGVALEECDAIQHRVIHRSSQRSSSYGELAVAAAAVAVPNPKLLRYKSKQDFNYIGKSVAVVDLDDMLTGNAQYGVDIQRPGMLIASIERCPVLAGTVKHFNDKQARAIHGVVDVIEIKTTPNQVGFHPLAGVAVIASNTWAALKGREALQIEWDLGANQSYNSKKYRQALRGLCQQPGKVWRQRGDAASVLQSAEKTFSATYTMGHIVHAPMEPPMATAEITSEGCEVWASVQVPQATRNAVAAALNFKPEQVIVNVTLLGGGFGRKSKPDFAVEAAILAKAVGRPVKVCWSREDDIRHSYYHAASAQTYTASLNKLGRIEALEQHVAAPTIMSTFALGSDTQADWEVGQGFANIPYDIANIHAESHGAKAYTRIGWMRAVFNVPYAFAANSFIDEVARSNNLDPLQYQLDMLGDDRDLDTAKDGFANFAYGKKAEEYPLQIGRLKNAISRVKASVGWPQKTAKGEGWGIAAHPSFLSYVAVATKVRLSAGDNKKLDIKEVHIAIDAGQLVNPDRVRAQMEGSVIFALSSALYGDIQFENGAVQQSNFHDYPVLRMDRTPKIVVTLIDSEEKHTGVGEPGVPPVAPSLTSAIAAAGGERIRDLPIAQHLEV